MTLKPCLAVLLGLLVAGCGGGGGPAAGPAPDPDGDPVIAPIVTAVNPDPAVGTSGTLLRFSAEISGLATGLHWDFGPGATPRTSIDVSPNVRLRDPGVFQATLVAVNGAVDSEAFRFSYQVVPTTSGGVDVPHILSVTGEGQTFAVGSQFTFAASAFGEVDGWSWDFGEVVEPSSSGAATPTVTFREEGTHFAEVRALNTHGNSPTYPFTYTVE